MIGNVYPSSLYLGTYDVSKVMCGSEQIWPHDAPNGNNIMLHIVYHDLYDLDVWELVKVIPRMKAWTPSSDWTELMTYYGYEKKTSGAIDFTVSVNCKKEDDGTLSFKNIITYEDGTVVEQEHLSEVNKRQVENGESFSTHIDMYNWCESGSHYTADPVTVYMSTTVA